MPTILEIKGTEMPTHIHGVEQYPLSSVSMAYVFDEAQANDVLPMDDRSAAEVLDMVAGESFAFRLRLIMPAATDPESEQHRQLVVADLESRIRTLETADESQFGAFTRVDWLLTALISLLLPFLAWLWLRP